MSERNDETAEFIDAAFAKKFFAPLSPGYRIDVGAATHQGKVRPNNEDHFVVVKRRRTNEILLTNLPTKQRVLNDESTYALAVADGIGGARFGELASRLVMQRMFELAGQATSWVMKYTDMEAQQIRERVNAYVQEIQTTLRDYMSADPALKGMGTTWTSAHLFLPHVLFVHLGDSRGYVLMDGVLHQVTRDETVAQECIEWGVAPEAVTKFRRMLLNSFGGDDDEVEANLYQLEIQGNAKLLLCTDGLTDMVSDEDIANVLVQASTPQIASDQLIESALQKGGRDNITVVVASMLLVDPE